MRYLQRLPLGESPRRFLRQMQAQADEKLQAGILNAVQEWANARRRALMRRDVLGTLLGMAGDRERCMYCVDSRGCDIEHYWPKTPYPERMFAWENLLLCCPDCGRLKGDRFPLLDGAPLLIDPSAEDPWGSLDFDPATGNITARYDLASQDLSPRGQKTVEILRLDRRESVARGYQRTWRRLVGVVENFCADPAPGLRGLAGRLTESDDHGLLGWCLNGAGRTEPPFDQLLREYPELPELCRVMAGAPARGPLP